MGRSEPPARCTRARVRSSTPPRTPTAPLARWRRPHRGSCSGRSSRPPPSRRERRARAPPPGCVRAAAPSPKSRGRTEPAGRGRLVSSRAQARIANRRVAVRRREAPPVGARARRRHELGRNAVDRHEDEIGRALAQLEEPVHVALDRMQGVAVSDAAQARGRVGVARIGAIEELRSCAEQSSSSVSVTMARTLRARTKPAFARSPCGDEPRKNGRSRPGGALGSPTGT